MDNVKDGFLSAQEFGNIPDCPTSNAVCCEAGKYCVTKHFVLLDKDKDGKLSRQEYEAGDMAGSWMNYPGEEKHWLAQHPDVEQWFISSQLRTKSRRLNMTNCDELEAAIDEECRYDGTQVTKFTKAMKENGGDFTISFWVKPTGANSLVTDISANTMFLPQVLCMLVQLFACTHVPLCICLTNQLTTNHNSTRRYGFTAKPLLRKQTLVLAFSIPIQTPARFAWIQSVAEETCGPLRTFPSVRPRRHRSGLLSQLSEKILHQIRIYKLRPTY